MNRYPGIRFWSRVIIKGEDDCWLWIGGVGSKGYSNFTIKERQVSPHRYAYEFAFGKFDNSLPVLHKCDTPLCCNPRHLKLGTYAENTKDMNEKKRGRNSRKTECLKGHAYNESNTYYHKSGSRDCLICRRERSRDYMRLERLIEKNLRQEVVHD